ncbi:MAG: AmmeMemoRadiSam system protein A [Candidatus Diapherotrites archaeon]
MLFMNNNWHREALSLAKNAIHYPLKKGKRFVISESEIKSKELLEERACFVTLHENGLLRGCIGNTEPFGKLYSAIIRNAELAAFSDPRFLPVEEHELDKIVISISVLGLPKKLEYSNVDDLLSKLDISKGVIIKKGLRQATFLPEVWEQFDDKVSFLEELCLKAGLSKDAWKKGVEVFVYDAELID